MLPYSDFRLLFARLRKGKRRACVEKAQMEALESRVLLTNVAPVVNDQTFGVDPSATMGAVVGTVLATDSDLVSNLTFRFGNQTGVPPVLELTSFDNGLMDGLANQIFEPAVGTDNTFELLSGGVPVAVGTLDIMEAITNPSQVTFAEFTLTFTGAVGGDTSIYDEILAASNGTGVMTATTGTFSFEGALLGIGDSSLFTSTGTGEFNNMGTIATVDFDFNVVASDLHPTFRIFGSPDPDDAPYTEINFGLGTVNSVTNLPTTNSSVFVTNEPVTYEITGGSGASVFAIDENSGEITVIDAGALGSASSFTLDVTVTDMGVPELSDTATITINVTAGDDILYFDSSTNRFKLGNNNGNSFTWDQTGAFPTGNAFTGDFDGDGDNDAAIFNPVTKRLNWIRNDNGQFERDPMNPSAIVVRPAGTVSFGAPIDSFLGVLDINGDDVEEILYLRDHPVLMGQVQIWSKAVSGLEDFKITANGGYSDWVIGDFNGDGLDDVTGLIGATSGPAINIIPFYAVNSGGNLTPVLASGQFGFGSLTSFAAIDLNNDGRDDIVGKDSFGQIFHATTTGNVRPNAPGVHNFVVSARAPVFSSITYPAGFLVGEFNNDDLGDLFAARSTGSLYVSTTSLNLAFLNPVVLANPPALYGSGPTGLQYVVGDFDGDGVDDIAGLAANAYVFLSTGAGNSFGAAMNFGPVIGGAGTVEEVAT
ncbi:MAG: hypothetical protein KDA80_10410 [Planctomycetaceae bacterium]|nr:hypothetical protein [Planctomycetaceae bacterium]